MGRTRPCQFCKPGDPCERHFQEQVVEMAHLRGWRVAHFRPAMTRQGWRTPVSADGVGFPDLILVRPDTGQMLAMELKRDRGQNPTPEQQEWLLALSMVPGVTALCARPRDWPEIERLLAR